MAAVGWGAGWRPPHEGPAPEKKTEQPKQDTEGKRNDHRVSQKEKRGWHSEALEE